MIENGVLTFITVQKFLAKNFIAWTQQLIVSLDLLGTPFKIAIESDDLSTYLYHSVTYKYRGGREKGVGEGDGAPATCRGFLL